MENEKQPKPGKEEGFAINYSELPPHMQDGCRDYVESGITPGGFLRAVMENDLVESYGRADMTNSMMMNAWAAFLYNYAPADCWGSRELVDHWIKIGGLRGMLLVPNSMTPEAQPVAPEVPGVVMPLTELAKLAPLSLVGALEGTPNELKIVAREEPQKKRRTKRRKKSKRPTPLDKELPTTEEEPSD